MNELIKRILRPAKVAVEAHTGSLRARRAHRQAIRRTPTVEEAIQALETRWGLGAIRNSIDAEVLENRPVFVLSAGWRSGSTLLQRLLMSSGETLIWGEPYDRACYVQKLARSLREFTSDYPPDHFFLSHHQAGVTGSRGAADGREDQGPAGHGGGDSVGPGAELGSAWIANMYPDPVEVHAAHRAFFLGLYEAPARKEGFRFWGLKEVRLSVQDAFYLRWLFPAARFVFLIRNPYHAYRSYRRLGPWYDRWPDRLILTPRQFGEKWTALAGGFIQRGTSLGYLVRYEELTVDGTSVGELSAALDIDLKRDVLLERITGRAHRELDPVPGSELRQLRRAVQPLAAELGYHPG